MNQTHVTAIALLIVAALITAFGLIHYLDGPVPPDKMGKVGWYICTAPDCGRRVRMEAPAGGDLGLAPLTCPYCKSATLAPAERCNSCGALIPRPPVETMPGSLCPVCGGAVYGTLPADAEKEVEAMTEKLRQEAAAPAKQR